MFDYSRMMHDLKKGAFHVFDIASLFNYDYASDFTESEGEQNVEDKRHIKAVNKRLPLHTEFVNYTESRVGNKV